MGQLTCPSASPNVVVKDNFETLQWSYFKESENEISNKPLVSKNRYERFIQQLSRESLKRAKSSLKWIDIT